MSRKIFCIGAYYFVAATLVRGDIHSSVIGLQELVTTQKLITERLTRYVDAESGKLALVREYLNKLKLEQMDTVINAGNPEYKLSFLKRLTSDIELIKEVANNKTEFELPLKVSDCSPVRNVKYPSEEDLTEAAMSVVRLQQTYLLDMREMAAGRIRGSTSTPMTANDCYELGRVLYEGSSYEASTGWFLEAYHMVDPEKARQRPVLVANKIKALCYAYIALDDMENVDKWVQKLEDLGVNDIKFMGRVKDLLSTWKSDNYETKKPILDKKSAVDNLTRDYGRLCRGETEQPPEIKYRLKCQYLRDTPFLMLAPIKMEQLYIEPDVFLLYDVISDSEIEQIKTVGNPNLQRSKVAKSNGSIVAKIRISTVSWLDFDDEDTLEDRIYTRIEDISGLSTVTAESIQLAAYPPGGMYMPHYDTFKDTFLDEKHRIATVMFYVVRPGDFELARLQLSDVEAGGATVFMYLGLTVFPIKGAALFWYNVYRDGEKDMKTLHAACPVLLGQKWTANIWLKYVGQEFLYPCEKEEGIIDETISPPVWKLSSEAEIYDKEDLKNYYIREEVRS